MPYFNIGCGFSAGEGWENYDASPTLRFERLPILGRFYTKNDRRFPASVQYGDILKGPLCGPGQAEGIYASHILEHLTREDAAAALVTLYGMLKDGGLLRIVVPDLRSRAQAYLAREDADAADWFMQETHVGRMSRPRGLMGRLAAMIGSSPHLWMYDVPALSKMLDEAGFRDVRVAAFGDSEDPMFAHVEDEGRFKHEYGPEVALQARK